MTDRISGPSNPTPIARPRPVLATGLGQAAPTASDALKLAGRAVAPMDGLLPVAPAIRHGFQDLVDWVDHGFKSLGHELHHVWGKFTGLLHRMEPYGLGVKLHLKDQHQYPSALSRYWLDVKEPGAMSTAQLEREVQAELAKGQAHPPGSLRWKGWEPDRRAFALTTGQQLSTILADPKEVAFHAVRITQRVLTPAQQARQTLYEDTKDPMARELADQAVQLAAEAARDAHVEVVEAYARLSPGDRRRTEALRQRFEGSPRVQEALDGLVQGGRLLAQDLRGGKTTLDQLEALATAQLAPEIAAQRLETLGETIMEVAQPGSISQRGRNTCGAACAQGTLAQESPAEYVRLVLGLASPEGTVLTTTGTELKRNAKWAVDDHEGDRTVPSRLLQSSFMEISSNGSYDNELDRGRWPGLFDWVGHKLHLLDGSYPGGEARLLHAVTGRDFYPEWNGAFEQKGEGFEHASREHPVMALMNYNDKEAGESLHWVRVIGYDKAKDEYRTINARARNHDTDAGTEDVISGADFVKHHVAIVHEGRPPGSVLLA